MSVSITHMVEGCSGPCSEDSRLQGVHCTVCALNSSESKGFILDQQAFALFSGEDVCKVTACFMAACPELPLVLCSVAHVLQDHIPEMQNLS